MKYIPDEHEHIVHVYRRDEPHGTERALCGWRPPDTWRPKNGRPAPLTVLPDCERCPKCLDRVAREPDQLYALMPPEDWIGWEGAAMAEQAAMSEQDPSGDPVATGPRESKVGATVAQAYARVRRRWNKKAWWVLSSGLILLAIAVAAVASGGSGNSSTTASDSRAANSGSEATPKESKQGTPASIGQTGGLPLQDGDWRLDSITVASDSRGDFVGSASITYTGGNPEGGDNLFTVTLRKDGKAVGTLHGKADGVMRGDAATVQLASSDPWVGGPYTYDFRAEL